MNSQLQNNDSSLSVNGRFGRLSYLAWNLLLGLVVSIIGIGLAILVPNLISPNIGSSPQLSIGLIIILVILYIAIIYFTFIFTIRRLHDRNQSGWLSLVMLIPLINFLFWVYLSCAKGDQTTNNYGAPRVTAGWEKVLGWIYIVIIPFSIGLIAAVGIPAYQNYIIRAEQIQYQINQSQFQQE